MRAILLFLALAVALSAAVNGPMYHPVKQVKQKIAKSHAVKVRKSKIKGRKAPQPRRRSNQPS